MKTKVQNSVNRNGKTGRLLFQKKPPNYHDQPPELFERPIRFQTHQSRKSAAISGNRPDPGNKIGPKEGVACIGSILERDSGASLSTPLSPDACWNAAERNAIKD